MSTTSNKKKVGRPPKDNNPSTSSSSTQEIDFTDNVSHGQQPLVLPTPVTSSQSLTYSDLESMFGRMNMKSYTPSLFGLPLGNPSHPPLLEKSDQFTEWKSKFIAHCVLNNMGDLLTLDIGSAWKRAVSLNFANIPLTTLWDMFAIQHRRLVALIQIAIQKVIGNFVSVYDAVKTLSCTDPNSGTITPPGATHIECTDNANLVWKVICAQYEKRTVFSVLGIWKQLMSLSYKRNEDPSKLYIEFDKLIDRLNQSLKEDKPRMGQVLPESCKAVLLLNSLPQSFGTETAVLMAKEQVSTDEIKSMLNRCYDKDQGRINHTRILGLDEEEAYSMCHSNPSHRYDRTNRQRGGNRSNHGKSTRHDNDNYSQRSTSSDEDTNWSQTF